MNELPRLTLFLRSKLGSTSDSGVGVTDMQKLQIEQRATVERRRARAATQFAKSQSLTWKFFWFVKVLFANAIFVYSIKTTRFNNNNCNNYATLFLFAALQRQC